MIVLSNISCQHCCILGEGRQDSDPLFSMLMTLQVFSLQNFTSEAVISLPWNVDDDFDDHEKDKLEHLLL